ncbi:MAG: sugar ABC transporter permease, partial [Nitrososphaerota archaeon]|nr:sugar ABC transporter permease [Nitrososphaerota archaeon]
IMVNVWRFSPFATLVYLSALQSIPKELYEAAEIDGASSFKKFTSITLPNLKSIFIVMTVIGVLLTYGYFDVVWLTTRGGPGTETLIPPVYVWLSGFYEFNLGKAAAISTITALIMLAFSILYLKVAAKK